MQPALRLLELLLQSLFIIYYVENMRNFTKEQENMVPKIYPEIKTEDENPDLAAETPSRGNTVLGCWRSSCRKRRKTATDCVSSCTAQRVVPICHGRTPTDGDWRVVLTAALHRGARSRPISHLVSLANYCHISTFSAPNSSPVSSLSTAPFQSPLSTVLCIGWNILFAIR